MGLNGGFIVKIGGAIVVVVVVVVVVGAVVNWVKLTGVPGDVVVTAGGVEKINVPLPVVPAAVAVVAVGGNVAPGGRVM